MMPASSARLGERFPSHRTFFVLYIRHVYYRLFCEDFCKIHRAVWTTRDGRFVVQ